MNTLVELPVVLQAVTTARQFGVNLTHLYTKACVTESFSEREYRDIVTWSLLKS